MKTRIQLYTVPGQVFYDATRKLVLRGADAVVFVADSQAQALDGNKESFQNLIENLREQGTELEKLPHVIQYNKRDIANALPVATLDRELNRFGAPTFEACATRGTGVRETLKGVALLVLRHLSEKYGGGEEPASAELFAAPAQAARATLVVPPDLPEPDRAIRATGSGPLEVEDLGAGELLDELEELPITQSGGLAADPALGRGSSVVEVPVVLDRSLFSGDSPVEIRLKLYLK
jgi:hypothetical protein